MAYLIRLSGIVWRLGLSGRGARLFFGTALLVTGSAYLAALFSLRQPGTVALDAGISVYKILVVLLAVIWVQELICRDLDRKSVLLPLSCPMSRADYLLSRFFGIWAMLLLATVMMAVGPTLIAYLWSERYPHHVPLGGVAQVATTFALLFLDATIILAFTVAIASVATVQALPLLAGVAFAVIGRSIGPAVTFLTQVDQQHKWVPTEIHHAAGVVEWLLPDLSRFDLRGIALYSDAIPTTTAWLLAGVAVAYTVFFLAIAGLAFNKRDII